MRWHRGAKLVGGSGELHGSINLATLMHFEKKSPGTKICTCVDFDLALNESGLTWTGGEHLTSTTDGAKGAVTMHYYPDPAIGQVIILSITSSPSNRAVNNDEYVSGRPPLSHGGSQGFESLLVDHGG